MPIAHTVRLYLTDHQTPFDLVPHAPTASSLRTATKAHIGAGSLAKAVLLEDDLARDRFLVAVVPANRRVDLDQFTRRTGRPVHLATEEDAVELFGDCATGALPPLGPAYGVETVWDDSLMLQPELYFEAGDHEHLVHVKSRDFFRLLADCPHGDISRTT